MSLRVALDCPGRPANDWSSIATDIAASLGAPDDAVEVTSVVRTPAGGYRMVVEIECPYVLAEPPAQECTHL